MAYNLRCPPPSPEWYTDLVKQTDLIVRSQLYHGASRQESLVSEIRETLAKIDKCPIRYNSAAEAFQARKLSGELRDKASALVSKLKNRGGAKEVMMMVCDFRDIGPAAASGTQ